MTKSELIAHLAKKNLRLSQADIETAVNTILNTISQSLISGDRVEIRGFGTFTTKQRRQRVGRNPRTGQSITVQPKRAPAFKAGKLLRERLNTH